MSAAHPFLRGGFRPFFFGAAPMGGHRDWAVALRARWRYRSSEPLCRRRLASSRNAVRLRRRRRCGLPADRDPELDGPASDRRQTAALAVRLMGSGAARRALFIADWRCGRPRCSTSACSSPWRCSRRAKSPRATTATCQWSDLCSLFGLADAADYAGAAGADFGRPRLARQQSRL